MQILSSPFFNSPKILTGYLFLSSLIFFLRLLFFVSSSGSLEHDSGWYLGVAKNLAERGIYASSTNTAPQDTFGSQTSIHGRYSVQDEQGFVYFPAGVTVGPGYILPQALVLKLFGNGWWQYRLWPLLGFFGLLLFLFYFAYRLGGFWTLFLFQVWFWSIPSLYFQFAYEAYGETIAAFFLLGSFYFFLPLNFSGKYRFRHLLSAILFSFSCLTKYLYLLAGFPFLVFPVLAFLKRPPQRRQVISELLIFLFVFFAPIFLFELYRYFFLVGKFGLSGWQAVNRDFWLHFRQNGSGLSQSNFNWKFIGNKASLWIELGFYSAFTFWIIYLASPAVFLFKKIKERSGLFFLIYLSSLCPLIWYLFFSSFGWTRHIWPSLVLAMLIVSTIFVRVTLYLKPLFRKLFTILLLLVILPLNPSRLNLEFILPENVFDHWDVQRLQRGVQGLPASPFFSLSDQQQLIDFFSKQISPRDRIYYLGWFLVAEAPPLADKVFYSLDRYLNYDQYNLDDRKAYLIFGPYQLGKYAFVSPNYFREKSEVLCGKLVFTNSSYALCELKTNLSYQNQAYQ